MRDLDKAEPQPLGKKIEPAASPPPPDKRVRDGVMQDASGRMYTNAPTPSGVNTNPWEQFYGWLGKAI